MIAFDRDDRAFRRGRRISLWCLPPVLLIAVWVAAGDDWTDYCKSRREDVVFAPVGASIAYGGSEWRLDAFEPIAGGAPGTARLRVRVAVTPRDADAAAALARCVFLLADEDGKRWSGAGADRFSASALPTRCDGDYKTHPEAGTALRFEQIFTVPAVEAERVEPLLALDSERPRLVRLRRR